MYAIIDIETTGISPEREKITEIAIVQHDGQKVLSSWSTLINPERSIPGNITKLTGISNVMVTDAPKFYEVAKEILIQLEDKIVVAHNARFDLSFIQSEFKQLGFPFRAESMCTLSMSRKYLPGKQSYSLGRLCEELDIQNESAHRALSDAQATAELFGFLLGKSNTTNDAIDEAVAKSLHPRFDSSIVKQLPDACGVYYFRDEEGRIIYIGKSKTIRSRIVSHLNNTQTKRAVTMAGELVTIDYRLTGSELIALLKESHEIKMEKPKFNRAQRNSGGHFGIFHSTNEEGYSLLEAKRIRGEEIPIVSFNSLNEAKERLLDLCSESKLCQKLCGLYKSDGSCFHYHIKECDGACVGDISPVVYNKRVEAFKKRYAYEHNSMIITEPASQLGKKAVVLVENGKYQGYGYVAMEEEITSLTQVKQCIQTFPDNRDIQRIIKGYLRKFPTRISLIKCTDL